jgi:hypothetical protein
MKKTMTQRFKLISLLILLFANNIAYSEVRTFTYKYQKYAEYLEVYLRDNVYSQKHIIAAGKQIHQNTIVVHNSFNANLNSIYVAYKLEEGDKIILNTNEEREFTIIKDKTPVNDKYAWLKKYIFEYQASREAKLYPCIIFTKIGNEKKFGFIPSNIINRLIPENNAKHTTVNELLSYHSSPELTIIYAILPKNRNLPGKLLIKHKGEWVKDANGTKLELPVLGRSKNNISLKKDFRIYPYSDTPQGIYKVNGVMKHSKHPDFGNEPYLDIDDMVISPGRYSYNYDKFLMQNLVPTDVNNEYWANEFNLAQALGRTSFRIHSNNSQDLEKYLKTKAAKSNPNPIIPTSGCLNMGEALPKLMQILASLDVINLHDYPYNVTMNDDNVFSWNISDKIGLVYLIVKDEDR